MFLADTHMHSTVSFDGYDNRRDMAAASAKAGLSVICFTDHYDVINDKGVYCPVYNWEDAHREHAQIERHPGLEVLYGLEIGNVSAGLAAADRALQEEGLDCVIGSIHNASVALESADYYVTDYAAEPELCKLHLDDYIQQELELVRWGNFDTLGHLPYPLRYMRDKYHLNVTLDAYQEQITQILRTVAQEGKGLEVNTNRARTPLDDFIPLLKEFRALGGEFVTVGADAHETAHVGLGVQDAYSLIQDCGFRYVTVFRGRKPCPVKL